MSKNIQTYNSVVQTINDCLYRFTHKPETIMKEKL